MMTTIVKMLRAWTKSICRNAHFHFRKANNLDPWANCWPPWTLQFLGRQGRIITFIQFFLELFCWRMSRKSLFLDVGELVITCRSQQNRPFVKDILPFCYMLCHSKKFQLGINLASSMKPSLKDILPQCMSCGPCSLKGNYCLLWKSGRKHCLKWFSFREHEPLNHESLLIFGQFVLWLKTPSITQAINCNEKVDNQKTNVMFTWKQSNINNRVLHVVVSDGCQKNPELNLQKLMSILKPSIQSITRTEQWESQLKYSRLVYLPNNKSSLESCFKIDDHSWPKKGRACTKMPPSQTAPT